MTEIYLAELTQQPIKTTLRQREQEEKETHTKCTQKGEWRLTKERVEMCYGSKVATLFVFESVFRWLTPPQRLNWLRYGYISQKISKLRDTTEV